MHQIRWSTVDDDEIHSLPQYFLLLASKYATDRQRRFRFVQHGQIHLAAGTRLATRGAAKQIRARNILTGITAERLLQCCKDGCICHLPSAICRA
jgi:hypothetical protein